MLSQDIFIHTMNVGGGKKERRTRERKVLEYKCI
jgi:hypothetical protein